MFSLFPPKLSRAFSFRFSWSVTGCRSNLSYFLPWKSIHPILVPPFQITRDFHNAFVLGHVCAYIFFFFILCSNLLMRLGESIGAAGSTSRFELPRSSFVVLSPLGLQFCNSRFEHKLVIFFHWVAWTGWIVVHSLFFSYCCYDVICETRSYAIFLLCFEKELKITN